MKKRTLGTLFATIPLSLFCALITFYILMHPSMLYLREALNISIPLSDALLAYLSKTLLWFGIGSAILLPIGIWLIEKGGKKETVIPIKKTISIAWENTKKHIKFFILFLLLIIVVRFLFVIPSFFSTNSFVLSFADFIGSLVEIYFSLSFIVISLDVLANKKPTFNRIFVDFKTFVRFFVGTVLYALMTSLGFILFIIPGLYLTYKYILFPYYLVDKKRGILESFKDSGIATNGAKMDLLLYSFIIQSIMLISIIPFGLGLFLTVPISSIAGAYIYTLLKK